MTMQNEVAESREEIRTAVLASGRGSSFAALLEAWRAHRVRTRPVLLISNRSDAEVFGHAKKHGVQAMHLSRHTHADERELDLAMRDALREARAELVLTLGYLRKVGEAVLQDFSGRVFNMHPALLPRHGGPGMYGLRVHQAVLDAGETETGATLHEVTAGYDEGAALANCRVRVEPGDCAQTLAARVLHAEHELLRNTLARLEPTRLQGSLDLIRRNLAGCSREDDHR